MNQRVGVLLLLLATSLVVTLSAKSVAPVESGPREVGKKKPIHVSPSQETVTTPSSEPPPVEEDDKKKPGDNNGGQEGEDREESKKKEDSENSGQPEQDVPDKKKKDHSNNSTETGGERECPPVECADPDYQDGCPSCEDSQCMFRGCVRFGAFFPIWKPEPCTVCLCIDGQEECTITDCGEEPECHGFPLVTKPGQCCPKCDYGLAKDECGVIPHRVQSLYVSLGDEDSCQTDVLLHKCNREYVYDSNEKEYYLCKPVEGVHQIELHEKCETNVHGVTYTDVKECVRESADPSELARVIPADYGPSDDGECPYYVEY